MAVPEAFSEKFTGAEQIPLCGNTIVIVGKCTLVRKQAWT